MVRWTFVISEKSKTHRIPLINFLVFFAQFYILKILGLLKHSHILGTGGKGTEQIITLRAPEIGSL